MIRSTSIIAIFLACLGFVCEDRKIEAATLSDGTYSIRFEEYGVDGKIKIKNDTVTIKHMKNHIKIYFKTINLNHVVGKYGDNSFFAIGYTESKEEVQFGGGIVGNDKVNGEYLSENPNFNGKFFLYKNNSQKTKINNAAKIEIDRIKSYKSPQKLYILGYKHEKTNKDISIKAYTEIIDRFPMSELAIKAIDRIDKLNDGHSKSEIANDGELKLTEEEAAKIIIEHFDFPEPIMPLYGISGKHNSKFGKGIQKIISDRYVYHNPKATGYAMVPDYLPTDKGKKYIKSIGVNKAYKTYQYRGAVIARYLDSINEVLIDKENKIAIVKYTTKYEPINPLFSYICIDDNTCKYYSKIRRKDRKKVRLKKYDKGWAVMDR